MMKIIYLFIFIATPIPLHNTRFHLLENDLHIFYFCSQLYNLNVVAFFY